MIVNEAVIREFSKTHPEVWAWIEANRANNQFAQDLYEHLVRFGVVTPLQCSVVRKIIKRDSK